MGMKPFNSVGGISVGITPTDVIYANGDIITGNLAANTAITRNSRNVPVFVYQGNIAPTSPLVGDQWYDTVSGTLFEYLDDGTTRAWLDMNGSPGGVWTGPTDITTAGNANVGNLGTTGLITASGNITGGLFLGNAAGLTNIPAANINGIVANANYANTANFSNNVEGYVKVPFNFDTVSPRNIAVVPGNAVVSEVNIVINIPFNDPTATVEVGTVANLTQLVTANDVTTNIAGTYVTMPGTIYLSDTHIILTINPGSSSTGNGMLIINF
jgi:hypothetical protein